MNILITGAAGYIGSHVLKLLLENTSHNITVVDNLSTGFLSTIETLKTIRNFEFIKADLSDWNLIEGIFKNGSFDSVIHFAASIVVEESMKDPVKYYLNNTANTANLVGCIVRYKVKKLIFSSTASVYGEPDIKEARKGLRETSITNPINPYGKSKLFSENIIIDSQKAYRTFRYVILRYFNVAGASEELLIGQKTKNATHLIKIASQCAAGKRDRMYIFGDNYPTKDGTCIRDYIHVLDLADAHIKAIGYLESHESDIFNVGYGRGLSVKEVINAMKKVSGRDFRVDIAPKRAGDPAVLIANPEKIKDKMNWKPRYNDIEFICKTAYEWEMKLGKIKENYI